MKRYRYFIAVVAFLLISTNIFAYGYNTREQARFLTDKMTYELGLNPRQYTDVFEINYDFINAAESLRYDILRGNSAALDRYYSLLDYRNQDIYWVLNSRQYRSFTSRNYFYRPIYRSGSNWGLRIFINYTNHNHYYYAPPTNYRYYNGRSYRGQGQNYYYRDRYSHSRSGKYNSFHSNQRRYNNARKEDFGYRDQRSYKNRKESYSRDYRPNENRRNIESSRNNVDRNRSSHRNKKEYTRPNNEVRREAIDRRPQTRPETREVRPSRGVNNHNPNRANRSSENSRSSVRSRGTNESHSNRSVERRSRNNNTSQSERSRARSTQSRALSENAKKASFTVYAR